MCLVVFIQTVLGVIQGVKFSWLDDLHRPSRPLRLSSVLPQQEVAAVFAEMNGVHGLMGRLLYGTGMRLMECMMLRVKDVDFGRREIIVRFDKGGKDRVTMLPLALAGELREQIARARLIYDADRIQGRPGVMLSDALERKYTKAATQWGWLWVFPSDHESKDPGSGILLAVFENRQGEVS